VAGLTNGGHGLFGGYPAAPSVLVLYKGTQLGAMLNGNTMPGTLEELRGTASVLPYTNFEINRNDVLYFTLGMGGGYGSPLDRDPEAVRDDVEDELVSVEVARSVYAVILEADTLTVDLAATEALRRKRRLENLGSVA
jgi:N-methylhydantoinase B